MKMNIKKIYILIFLTIITIIPNKVTAIEIIKSQILLDIGYSETLDYNIDDGELDTDVKWKSSNEKVAIVNKGKVTALTRGTAIITATINGKSSTSKVTVSDDYIAVESIKINQDKLTIAIGEKHKLTTSITPTKATNKNVAWKTSDANIVTVDKNGNITAKKVGSAIITAAAGKYSSTCKITVLDEIALKKITLNKTSITIKEKASETLNVIYSPTNATDKKVTWKSSNTSIVTVNQEGKITALKPGTATITAISNDNALVATSKITVQAISKKVESISFEKKEIEITAGEETTLKIIINPNYAENKNITWSSEDKKIATIENGILKAISPGTTEIKAISEDGNKEAICKVTVTAPDLKSISFKNESQTIYLNEEFTLKPILEPSNSLLETAIWKSEDENIVTVENGKLKGKSIGKTTITVSTNDDEITASIEVIVEEKPKEKLNIIIEGYNLNFNPEQKKYDLTIDSEKNLKIKTNVSDEKVTIKGNQNLKDGSVITITIDDGEINTYIITINKKQSYTIYFIAIISILLLLNLIRIIISNKKKNN